MAAATRTAVRIVRVASATRRPPVRRARREAGPRAARPVRIAVRVASAEVGAVAAAVSGRLALSGTVCVVLSGGNIDPLLLRHVTTHGLTAAGRFLTVTATVSDRPGGLVALLELLRDLGASVLDVVHSRVADDLYLGEVQVTVSVETRGHDHQHDVRRALADAGFLRD